MFDRVVTGSEKKQVESHKNLLCLDDDLALLHSLLEESKDFLTKGKAKKLSNLTVNLDTSLRKSIASKRSLLLFSNSEDRESNRS